MVRDVGTFERGSALFRGAIMAKNLLSFAVGRRQTQAVLSVGLIVVLGLSLTAIAPASASRAPAVHVAHHKGAYTPPPIKWHKCTAANSGHNADLLRHSGAKCGYVIVPLTYAHPSGRTIKLAISRVKHKTTSSGDDKGVMLVNPGGPGGSGLVYSILQFGIPHNAGDSYDWIGWDPRGVGHSIPALSCNPSFFQGPRPPYRPATPANMQAWVDRSKQYAADCTSAPGHRLFNHVKTVDTVQDMESIRRALGRSKINFYGFSYGTYLASVYMTLHPRRVGRFVLDSTVDPRHVWYQANLNQDIAFQKTFDAYFTWLAKHHSVYGVGATHKAVRKLFRSTQAALDAQPANGFLGGDELLDVFTSAGYYVYGWEDIAAAYSKYTHSGDANPLIKLYKDAHPTSAGGDNSYTIYLATQCTDAQWPQSQKRLNRDSRHLDQKYDYYTWANAWYNGPCPYWHYPNSQPVHVNGSHVKVPILMIDETYDPATPYQGSLYVRHIFPTASLIEGKNGTTHAGSLSGVACTDKTIAKYLATGAVPQRRSGDRSDKVCRPVPKPNPAAPTARSRADGGHRTAIVARIRVNLEATAIRR
jgi:pimeloyl-ACP methyl ester carboxylesterase